MKSTPLPPPPPPPHTHTPRKSLRTKKKQPFVPTPTPQKPTFKMAAKFCQTFVAGGVKSGITQQMAHNYCFIQLRCIISYSSNNGTEIRMSTLLEDYGVTIKPGSNLEHWMVSQERNESKYDVPAVKQRLDYLTSLGIKKKDMVKPLNKRPWVLKHDMKQMHRNVTFLESLGIRGDSLTRVFTSVPQVSSGCN